MVISFGKIFQIFGSKNENDSVPYLTEFNVWPLEKSLRRKL